MAVEHPRERDQTRRAFIVRLLTEIQELSASQKPVAYDRHRDIHKGTTSYGFYVRSGFWRDKHYLCFVRITEQQEVTVSEVNFTQEDAQILRSRMRKVCSESFADYSVN